MSYTVFSTPKIAQPFEKSLEVSDLGSATFLSKTLFDQDQLYVLIRDNESNRVVHYDQREVDFNPNDFNIVE